MLHAEKNHQEKPASESEHLQVPVMMGQPQPEPFIPTPISEPIQEFVPEPPILLPSTNFYPLSYRVPFPTEPFPTTVAFVHEPLAQEEVFLNPPLLNPALLNPALLNPGLLNPGLFLHSPGPTADIESVLNYLKARGRSLDNTPWSDEVRRTFDDPLEWVYAGPEPPRYIYPAGRQTTQTLEVIYDENVSQWTAQTFP